MCSGIELSFFEAKIFLTPRGSSSRWLFEHWPKSVKLLSTASLFLFDVFIIYFPF